MLFCKWYIFCLFLDGWSFIFCGGQPDKIDCIDGWSRLSCRWIRSTFWLRPLRNAFEKHCKKCNGFCDDYHISLLSGRGGKPCMHAVLILQYCMHMAIMHINSSSFNTLVLVSHASSPSVKDQINTKDIHQWKQKQWNWRRAKWMRVWIFKALSMLDV